MRSRSSYKPRCVLFFLLLGLVNVTIHGLFANRKAPFDLKNAFNNMINPVQSMIDLFEMSNVEKDYQLKFINGVNRLLTSETGLYHFCHLMGKILSKNEHFKKSENLSDWMKKLREFLVDLGVVSEEKIKLDSFKGQLQQLQKDSEQTEESPNGKGDNEEMVQFENEVFTEEMMDALLPEKSSWTRGQKAYLTSLYTVLHQISLCIENGCLGRQPMFGTQKNNKKRLNEIRMKVLLTKVFERLDLNLASSNPSVDSMNQSAVNGLVTGGSGTLNHYLGYGTLALLLAYNWLPWEYHGKYSTNKYIAHERTTRKMPRVGTLSPYADASGETGSRWFFFLLLFLVVVGAGIALWLFVPWNKTTTEKKDKGNGNKGKPKKSILKKNEKADKGRKKKALSEMPERSNTSSSIILRERANVSSVHKLVTSPTDSPVSKITSKMTKKTGMAKRKVVRNSASSVVAVTSSTLQSPP